MRDEWHCGCGLPFGDTWAKTEFGLRFRFCVGESWWRRLLGFPRHDIMIRSRSGTETRVVHGRSFRYYLSNW